MHRAFAGGTSRWLAWYGKLKLALKAARSGNRGKFACGGSSQLGLGVIHTAGDSCWLRPG